MIWVVKVMHPTHGRMYLRGQFALAYRQRDAKRFDTRDAARQVMSTWIASASPVATAKPVARVVRLVTKAPHDA